MTNRNDLDMTPEEREKLVKKFQSLPPRQRKEILNFCVADRKRYLRGLLLEEEIVSIEKELVEKSR
jgi:hypothetical protein